MFFVIFWTALVRYTWPSNSSRFFFRQSVLSDVFGLNAPAVWARRCGAGGCRREATWISSLLQNAFYSNVQSITSTSKKCHLLVQNAMSTHDSCMFWSWYDLETNLWYSDLHLTSIFLQRVPNEAKNEAKTRPERGQKIALETPQL